MTGTNGAQNKLEQNGKTHICFRCPNPATHVAISKQHGKKVYCCSSCVSPINVSHYPWIEKLEPIPFIHIVEPSRSERGT